VPSVAQDADVGLDLGLRETVASSDGDKLEAGEIRARRRLGDA
jgi:hypothetical protein